MTNRLFYFLCFGFLVACGSDRLNIKVEEQNFDIRIERLDQDLANTKNTKELLEIHKYYSDKHEEFYNFFLGACLQVGMSKDSLTLPGLNEFLKDPYIKSLHLEMGKEFSNLDSEINSFQQGLSYLKHHFPEATIPSNIIFYNSLFTNSVVSSENTIGVGLERYLGENSPSIESLPEDPFYPYIKKRMNRDFLLRDMMMSWLGSNVLPEIQDERELADVMIQWGKHFYALEACFPKLDKRLIIRYFKEEYAWAERNEKEFWNYLVSQNCLFKRDYKMALNIFADGPFTSGLPIEDNAPPRLGQYLGWSIVKNYMNKNNDVSLVDLMATDFKTIIKSYN